MSTVKEKKKLPELRFSGFVEPWKKEVLGKIFERRTQKNKRDEKNVLTISAQQGLVSQKEFFTKSVSSKDISGY